jgi:two-component system CheB/CheR fusion protein
MKNENEEVIRMPGREPDEYTLNPGQLSKIAWAGSGRSAIKFPVVGLGCSAGGINALEVFFRNMPARTGIAFVVITHLDPGKKGMMPEVVQRFTRMPVVEITDGMRLQPDTVHVIPPNRDVSVLQGNLLLLEPLEERGLRLPIDHFFESLAKDQRSNAICIILSGMGSDGSTGLKMIMENFGLVMVQDPKSAQFDSMPLNAIKTEFVDYILPPEAMPGYLLDYINHPMLKRPRETASEVMPAHALEKVYTLIRNQTGHDFSFYKRNTVNRRIERRMQSHQIAEFPKYVRFLQENPAEVEMLFRELLIGVTKFFRDHEAFERLQSEFLPPLVASKPEGSTIRVWIAGCSTGEEAYSIAILLIECLANMPNGYAYKLQLFATDIDSAAIDKARVGIYNENIVSEVNPERLQRFFNKVENGYQIRKEVRDLVVFAVHNLAKDSPFTKLDLLCCRNLLIYFSAELQKKLIPVFHYSLLPGGILFLGSSETISGFSELFVPLDTKWKISERVDSVFSQVRISDFPFTKSRTEMPKSILPETFKNSPEIHLPAVVQRVLLDQFAPPSVIVNQKGDIFYINGRTGKYLEPAAGQASLNIFEMAREGLRYELNESIFKAASLGKEVVAEPVKVQNEKGEQPIRLTVRPLNEPENLKGLLLVILEDVEIPKPGKKSTRKLSAKEQEQVAELEKELHYTRQRLQTTIEEMHSSLEELKSTNEELQSANEELQSTNEEAMTNKEELQSLNEELMTINAQFQTKADELVQSNNDMKNLLDSTEIATIFLDNELNIRNFTPQATQLFNLIRADIGRPITHISSRLNYTNLAADVSNVLNFLVAKEIEVPATVGDQWFLVRIIPYRTSDNFIDGAVITISDVTRFKRLETELKEARDLAESIINTVRDPLVVLDQDLNVISVSRSFCETFKVIPTQTRGHLLYHLGNGQWDIPELRQLMDEVFNGPDSEFNNYVVEHEFPVIGYHKMLLNGRKIETQSFRSPMILLAIQDITARS